MSERVSDSKNNTETRRLTRRIFGGKVPDAHASDTPPDAHIHTGAMGNNAGKPGESDAYADALEKGGSNTTETGARETRDRLAARQWLTTEARADEVTVSMHQIY